MNLLNPFPFWVVAEQKGSEVGGYYIAGHPSPGGTEAALETLSLI